MEKRVFVAIIVAVIIALLLMNSYSLMQVEEEKPKPEVRVSFHLQDSNFFNVTCEVADEPEERSHGLMDRESLPQDHGMLFVYDAPQNMSFWMKNTLIPLDIIFIHENRTVLNVEEAEVEDPATPDSELPRYRSQGPALWVVEINQGLSAEKGIGPGTVVDIETFD